MEENTVLKNINLKEAGEFITNTDSSVVRNTKEKSTSFDTTWIEKFEEALPYLDNIIRNPRRFIVPEEEVTIIEKTKKVTEESIKHLAKHASLVHEIDEEGFVKPSKLLNVYKEETYDLYENRFMYTLVNKLNKFINNVYMNDSFESSSNLKKQVNYNGSTNFDGDKIKISLLIELINEQNSSGNYKSVEELIERINDIRDIIDGFMKSDFIKSLTRAVPVKSPIRKTNVFLKEQNFKKALELWEFLEQFDNLDLTTTTESNKEESNKEDKNNFDFLYYLGYNIINPKENAPRLEDLVSKEESVYKFIENFLMDFNGTEKDFKKLMGNQYRIVINKRKTEEKEVYNEFRKVIQKFERRKKKALK